MQMSKNKNEIEIYNLPHINHHLLLAIAYQYPINTDGWERSGPIPWPFIMFRQTWLSVSQWYILMWQILINGCNCLWSRKQNSVLGVWPGCVFQRGIFEWCLNIKLIISNNRVRDFSYLSILLLVSSAWLDNQQCRAVHFQLQITCPDDECLLAQ